MKEINQERRQLWFEFIDLLAHVGENWHNNTQFKAIASVKYLEEMVEILRTNKDITEEDFLIILEKFQERE